MSFLSRLLFGPPASAAAVLGAQNLSASSGIIPPWATPGDLLPIVYSDIYGPTGLDAVTRDTAVTCAPIAKGLGIITSRIADLPLVAGTLQPGGEDGDEFVPDAVQPGWLRATGHPQDVWHRMSLTLDDLVFHGWSLWAVQRDSSGAITDAGRIVYQDWAFDTTSPTGVRIGSKPVINATEVILFAGPHEGILIRARDSIRGWRHMEAAWVGRVRNPVPLVVLHEAEANSVTQPEAEMYVAAWARNRTSPTGAVGWLPATINLEVYGELEADLFDKGRNAARLDLANHLGLPASALDGTAATASLTYVTQEGDRNALVDDLEMWMGPIESRLSQPDIAGPGKVIRFSRTNLTNTPNDPYGATATTNPKEIAA